MSKLPRLDDVLARIQEQPPAQETTESVLREIEDHAERLAFTLWASKPTSDMAIFQKHLEVVLGSYAPSLAVLIDWHRQSNWQSLYDRWIKASGYPQGTSPMSMDNSVESMEEVIERIGQSSKTLMHVIELSLSGGGQVRTSGGGVLRVPPLEVSGRLSELKAIADIVKALNEQTASQIEEWREEQAAKEREAAEFMDELDSAELIVCYMMDILKFTPPASLMRQLGASETFINSLVKLGGIDDEQERSSAE